MSDNIETSLPKEETENYYTGFQLDPKALLNLGIKEKHLETLSRFNNTDKEVFFSASPIDDQLRHLARSMKTQGYSFQAFEYVSQYQRQITPQESYFYTLWDTSGYITYPGLTTVSGEQVVFTYDAPKQKHPYEFVDLSQALEWFDAHFYVEHVGTELYVVDRAFKTKLSISAFLNQEASKTVPQMPEAATEAEDQSTGEASGRARGRPAKQPPLARVWLNQTQNMVKQTFFDPSRPPGLDFDLQTQNTYTGWAYAPSSPNGQLQTFLTFVLEGLANGRDNINTYLLDWMAHLVQRPYELPGVAIVLHGIEGTGKGFFAKVLGELAKGYSAEVADKRQVFGEFNSTLEEKFVITLDEALFHGDLASIDAFKGRVTNPELRIRRMREDAYKAQNYCRFVVTSNHEVPLNISETDRRFLVLKPSTKNVVKGAANPEQARAYWSDLFDISDDPKFYSALLGYLQARKITVDVRTPPATFEKVNVVSSSLAHEQVFFRDLVEEGFWLGGKLYSFDDEKTEILRQDIFDAYIESCKSQKYVNPLGKILFFRTLREVFATGLTDSPRPHGQPARFTFIRSNMINDLAGKGA